MAVVGVKPVRRGDVFLIDLDPTRGSEIQKTRPCVVVSPDELNAHLRTVIVAPLTTGGQPYPFRVPCRFSNKSGHVVTDQLRTIDRERLVRIGNSKGIRLPKPLIEQAGLTEEVELQVRGSTIIIAARKSPRSDWAEAAQRLRAEDGDRMLDVPTPTRFDDAEWQW